MSFALGRHPDADAHPGPLVMRDEGFRSVGESRNVVVIGGGVSGMTAALEAAEAGAEVFLVESSDLPGGRLMGMHKYFPKLDSPTVGLDENIRCVKGKVVAVSENKATGGVTVEVKTPSGAALRTTRRIRQ